MKLRSKIIMTIFVLLALATAVLYVVIASMPAEGVSDLEQAEARRDGHAIEQQLQEQLNQLVDEARYFGQWDRTYEFAQSGSPNDHPALDALAQRGGPADAIVILNQNHQPLANAGHAPAPQRDLLAQTVVEYLDEHPKLAYQPTAGFLASPLGSIMVAIEPIVHTSGDGKPMGEVAAIRHVNDALLNNLTARHPRTEIQLLDPTAGSSTDERAHARASRLNPDNPPIRYPEAGLITSYHALDDPAGNAALTLKVTSPRRFYEHARSVHRMALFGFVIFGILFGLFCLLLIDRLVLRRLGELSDEVDAIRMDSAAHLRVTEEGNDELSRLAGNINGMLEAISQNRDKLAAQEAKWRTLIENAPDEILILDKDSRIRFVNHDVYGYTAEELLDTSLLDLLPEQSQSAFQHTCEKAWENGDTLDLEHEIIHRDRSRHWLASRISLIHRDGEPVGLLQISNDITPQVQSQKQLKQAKDDAERANQVKTQLLANMSRDIRMPMTAIMGSAELLAADPHNENKLRQNLHVLKDSGERLVQLINDILDLARVEAGELNIEREPVEIPELINEIVRNMRPLAEAKGLSLDLQFQTAVPRQLSTDSRRLTQIMANLISNAVRNTEEGGVCLIVSVEEDSWSNPKWLNLAVRDTGVGIEPHQLEKLFTDYATGDTQRREKDGSAMGLAISRKLAQLLDGHITVNSTPGQGSCFTLQLNLQPEVDLELTNAPIVPAEESEQDSPACDPQDRTPDVSLCGTHILVAEDMPDNQFVIRAYLEDAKVNVTMVENGQQAVDEVLRANAAHEPFDLVLMDMQMPVMDGYTATQELRRLGVKIPVVALTAFALEYDEQKCLDAGCNAYIAKPIDQKRFFSRILEQLTIAAETEDF